MIREREISIIDEFSLFTESMDRYEHIISLGDDLEAMDESLKTDENIVKGCASKVWLTAELKDGKVWYHADSNTQITKGIISLLVRAVNGTSPDDILSYEFDFIDKIDLKSHLSSQRNNGLVSMIKQMKLYALAFKTQLNDA